MTPSERDPSTPDDEKPQVPPSDEDAEYDPRLTEEFDRLETALDAELTGPADSTSEAPEPVEDPQPGPGAPGSPPPVEEPGPAPNAGDEHPPPVEEPEPEPDAGDEHPPPVEEPAPEPAGPPAAEPAQEPASARGDEPSGAGEEPSGAGEPEPQPVTQVAPPPPAATPTPGSGEPGRAPRIWPRFFAACLAIIGSVAAATAISILVFLDNVADGFGGIDKVQGKLTSVEGGEPQNILILGSDKRPGDGVKGRSDTTLLVRVDPDNDAITLLSIPRDLKVEIPGYGTDKFNTAYTIGGPALTLKLVKELTDLPINHVININFTGFADAVDAIDCVYLDVDRHYFNDNSLAATVLDQYAEIDIEAGYQRLCGYNALQYVRYRHEDTDLVRAARQQDFLREARQKIEPKKLVFNADYRNDLVDVFKKYTTSDEALRDPIEVLALMKTFIAAREAPVREVHFPAQLGGPEDPYVTADNEAIAAAIDQFVGAQGTPGPSPTGEASPPETGGKGGEGEKPKPKPEKKPRAEPKDAEGLIGSADSGEAYARLLADVKRKNGDPMVEFPIFYPTRILASSTLNDASRAFPIDGPGDEVYYGYKMVAGFPGMGGFSEYYGFSGTDWRDPPILENPSEVRRIDGRDYMLFFDGDRLRLVGWKTGKGSYWVINTLTQTLDNDQLISMATGMRELGG